MSTKFNVYLPSCISVETYAIALAILAGAKVEERALCLDRGGGKYVVRPKNIQIIPTSCAEMLNVSFVKALDQDPLMHERVFVYCFLNWLRSREYEPFVPKVNGIPFHNTVMFSPSDSVFWITIFKKMIDHFGGYMCHEIGPCDYSNLNVDERLFYEDDQGFELKQNILRSLVPITVPCC